MFGIDYDYVLQYKKEAKLSVVGGSGSLLSRKSRTRKGKDESYLASALAHNSTLAHNR